MAGWMLMGLAIMVPMVMGQSKENLKQDTTVDAGHFGEIKTAFVTNKTKAFLSCETGDMVVTIVFTDPFYGVVYANRDPLSPCKEHGKGEKEMAVKLPLYGCGTREDQKRTFINDIVVRFREGLIVDEDEVKTIICRYGPPIAPIPAPLPIIPALPVESANVIAKPKRLSEAEIYVIVCVLLFLALLLLGVGLAYYCLKRRNIKVVRKRRLAPSGPPSEITKLSSTLSAFDGFRIPRAAAHSVSGSEAALLTAGDHSDTVPSDYPSESPSSAVSEADAEAERYTYETRDVRDDIFTISGTELAERSLTTIYEHERDLEEERRRRSIGGAAAAPPVYARIRKRQAELALLEEQDHVIPRAHTQSPEVATARRHVIDDRYLTTVTETRSEEDITKLTRETTDTLVRAEPRWDVLIRAFPPEGEDDDGQSTTGTESSAPDAVENAWEQLSYVSERTGEPIWKLVTTDETLRARLREARTVEEVETLRSDTRYQRLLQPRHWDVVIRILAAPEFERAPSESESSVAASEISVPRSAASLGSYYSKGARRKSDWDARSRRSSLPPVAEDDRLSAFDDDDDDEGWPRAHGPPAASVAERSTTEIVEGVGDYYESRPRLLRSVSGTEARHYDYEDEEDDVDMDERAWREASSSYRREQRGYDMRRIEGSSAEIILDSPLVAMMHQQGRGHPVGVETSQQSDWLMR